MIGGLGRDTRPCDPFKRSTGGRFDLDVRRDHPGFRLFSLAQESSNSKVSDTESPDGSTFADMGVNMLTMEGDP